MNRREFLKTAIATGIAVAYGKVSFETTEEEAETELDYRLTFLTIYKPNYRWGDGGGDWVHQHEGTNLLWAASNNDGRITSLGWHEHSNARAFNHDKYLEASNLVHGELNKIHWPKHLVEASFIVPRWTMIELGILPEETFHEQA